MESNKATDKDDKIVSSSHLAEGELSDLSEIEFGLITAHNAFARWVTQCMGSSGNRDLSYTEILVLHNVNHRQRPKRLADICYVLNVEDTHTIAYALRKLVRAELISGTKTGKEIYYSVTEQGESLCNTYAEVRQRCLLDSGFGPAEHAQMTELARFLRALSGFYDQAGRAAASL